MPYLCGIRDLSQTECGNRNLTILYVAQAVDKDRPCEVPGSFNKSIVFACISWIPGRFIRSFSPV